MKIKDLLKGKDKEAQDQLDELLNSIGENPNICWYPSAGNDYRNILELSSERANYNGIKELPDLFFHTDYRKKYIVINEGKAYEDKNTTVNINKSNNLIFQEDVDSFVNPNYVTRPEYAASGPEVYLLEIEINSNEYGKIIRPVIYFLFENINFFEEVLLRYDIKISHLVKIRDGSGSGTGKIGMDTLFFFLSKLETKYLISDAQLNYDLKIIDGIVERNNLEILDYEIGLLNILNIEWSYRESKTFSIRFVNQNLDFDQFEDNLNRIKNVNEKDRLSMS